MPRQNTCPADFPPFILNQIALLAQSIVTTRKSRGETQAQWAQKLGSPNPPWPALSGDPSVAAATYIMCLWLVNPQLNLLSLLDHKDQQASALTAPSSTDAANTCSVADEFADLLAQWQTPVL